MNHVIPFQNRLDEIKRSTASVQLPLYIYGAGLHASEIAACFMAEGIVFDGFFVDDPYVNGPHRINAEVISASQLLAKHLDFHVVIGICQDAETLRQSLRTRNPAGKGSIHSIDCRFWREFKELRSGATGLPALLTQLRAIWADAHSREIFDRVVSAKQNFNPDGLSQYAQIHQYFPEDLDGFSPRATDVVVDAGAYNGDTLREFLSLLPCGRCREYHAFEADPDNAQSFSAQTDDVAQGMVRLHAMALGKNQGKVSFSVGSGTSSKITEGGSLTVDQMPLDALNLDPTLIKMDIEGAECDALIGAASTIARCQPRLAICVYHSWSDFSRIPFLVKGLCPEYELYLRLHRPYTEEMVLYARLPAAAI
jgi:FkbM family methyltransferase